MENSTSFDLNRAIASWRARLAQSPAFRPENLDELESHLRDSITRLQAAQFSEEEVFLIATRRIGPAACVESEFAKLNQCAIWMNRLLWMLVGIQVWEAITAVRGIVSGWPLAWGWGMQYDYGAHGFSVPVVVFTLLQLAVLAGMVACCWLLIVRKGSAIEARVAPILRSRRILFWAGVGCIVIFMALPAIRVGLQALVARSMRIDTYSATIFCLNASYALVQLVETVLMVVATVLLIRKRPQVEGV